LAYCIQTRNNMKKRFFAVAAIALLMACNNDSDASAQYSTSQSYESQKMSLEEQEKTDPLEFLSAEGTYRQNLIDQWVLEGHIVNAASVATYKDAVLKITYYSATETELGSEEKTIYEYFQPGSKHSFKIKANGYEGTASVNFEVIGAVAVD
jgi:hypothetical protein